MTGEEMIEKFQCPGCVNGPNPQKCPAFKLDTECGVNCAAHHPGTMVFPGGKVALGLPVGFNKYRDHTSPASQKQSGDGAVMYIRLWPKGKGVFEWNKFNVPVWAMEEDGCLFVRTVSPRVNGSAVDVLEGETLALVPSALDVSKFKDEID